MSQREGNFGSRRGDLKTFGRYFTVSEIAPAVAVI